MREDVTGSTSALHMMYTKIPVRTAGLPDRVPRYGEEKAVAFPGHSLGILWA